MLTTNGHFNLSCYCCCETSILDERGFKLKVILQSSRRKLTIFHDGLFLYELPGQYKIFQPKGEILIDDLTDFCFIRDKFNRLVEIRLVGERVEFFSEPSIDCWEEGRLIVGK